MYEVKTRKWLLSGLLFSMLLFVSLIFFPFVWAILNFPMYYNVKVDATRSTSVYVNEKDKKRQRNVYYYQIDGEQYQYTRDTTYHNKDNMSGKKTIIYCNMKTPTNCTLVNPILFFFISVIPFIIFMGIWVLLLILTFQTFYNIYKIKKLKECGKLIKNYPYQLVNDRKWKLPAFDKAEIEYLLPSGKTIKLKGNIRLIYQIECPYDEEEDTIDLLIDEKNPKLYYMDSDMNRLPKNLPDDYYVQKKSTKK